jgi:hypothetical protein
MLLPAPDVSWDIADEKQRLANFFADYMMPKCEMFARQVLAVAKDFEAVEFTRLVVKRH